MYRSRFKYDRVFKHVMPDIKKQGKCVFIAQ